MSADRPFNPLRNRIVNLCVERLREFGYPKCNAGNVLTDDIYKRFALSMLRETLADTSEGSPLNLECKKLIEELNGENK